MTIETNRPCPAVADLIQRTRTDRGLPATVEDDGVLEQIATLIDPSWEQGDD